MYAALGVSEVDLEVSTVTSGAADGGALSRLVPRRAGRNPRSWLRAEPREG